MSEPLGAENVQIQFCKIINKAHFYVCASLTQFIEQDAAYSIILQFKDGKWKYWPVETLVVAISVFFEGKKNIILAIGYDGRVHKSTLVGMEWEIIGIGDGYPSNLRRITKAESIGNYVYACGMGRNVFRKSNSLAQSIWEKVDQGCAIEKNSDEIDGFLSINGFNDEELYAVGFHGGIWMNLKSAWYRVESPTNLKLTLVKPFNDKIVIGGNKGILITGRKHQWTVIDQQVTSDAFRYGAIIKDTLYLTTETGELLKFHEGMCERAEPKLSGNDPIYTIDGNNNLILASTTNYLMLFDGQSWERIELPM